MSNESASPLADAVAVPKTGSYVTRVTGALIALGIVLSVVALPDAGNRVRFGYAYLWGFAYLWTVLLGSLFGLLQNLWTGEETNHTSDDQADSNAEH